MKLILAACLLGVAAALPLLNDPLDGLLTSLAEIKLIIHTEYGYKQVKTYLQNLKSQDPIANDIRGVLKQHSDDELRGVLVDFFEKIPIIAIEPIPGFEYPGLKELFGNVKTALMTDEGVAAAREYMETLDTPNQILQGFVAEVLLKDNQELKHFFEVLLSDVPAHSMYYNYDTKTEMDETVQTLKAILTTPEGIQQARVQLNSIQTTNPALILVKTVLSAMSDKSLIDLIKELGKNVVDIELGSPQPDLLAAVVKGRDLILTDEGINYVREYMNNLETRNFLLIRLRSFLKEHNNAELHEAIRRGWKDIFGEDISLLYSPNDDLRILFVQIKHILKSGSGFQMLKKYLTDLKPKNLYVQIGKAYFLQMEESAMKEVLTEFLKGFHDIEIEEGFDYPGLAELFGRVKDNILTSDGLQQLRQYAANLQSDNPIVQRLQAALITVDDETLTSILVDLFQGV